MIRVEQPPTNAAVTPIQVRVLGPDSAELSSLESRRSGGHHPHLRARRDQLAHATRLVARVGSRTVGIAAYERQGLELRVLDLALDPIPPVCGSDIVAHLLDALEVAALAGGCRRVTLLPAAVAAATSLERLGYRVADAGSGAWLEKTFAS